MIKELKSYLKNFVFWYKLKLYEKLRNKAHKLEDKAIKKYNELEPKISEKMREYDK